MTQNTVEIVFESDEPAKTKCVVCHNERSDFTENYKTCNRCISLSKAYYMKTKEKKREYVNCECGCYIKKFSLNAHLKSKRHQTGITLKNKQSISLNDLLQPSVSVN